MLEKIQSVRIMQKSQSSWLPVPIAMETNLHMSCVHTVAGMQEEQFWLQKHNLTNHCLGLDLMGADVPPANILQAAVSLPDTFFSDTTLLCFAHDSVIEQYAALIKNPAIRFESCAEVISMEEPPVRSVKKKQRSSLVCGLRALQQRRIDAFVSCANTGALVAGSLLILKTASYVVKPALLTVLPSRMQPVVILDVGASLTSKALHLQQLAFVGAAYSHCVLGVERPRVALLNIGRESGKGDLELKKAWKLLAEDTSDRFHFIGNCEPEAIFAGKTDVVVTAGFAGNVFLKTAEAVRGFILDSLNASGMSLPQVQCALVCGLEEGVVIKCHGSASTQAIVSSLVHAKQLVQSHLLPAFYTYVK